MSFSKADHTFATGNNYIHNTQKALNVLPSKPFFISIFTDTTTEPQLNFYLLQFSVCSLTPLFENSCKAKVQWKGLRLCVVQNTEIILPVAQTEIYYAILIGNLCPCKICIKDYMEPIGICFTLEKTRPKPVTHGSPSEGHCLFCQNIK